MTYRLMKGQELLCYKCSPVDQPKDLLRKIKGSHFRGSAEGLYRVEFWICRVCKLAIERRVDKKSQ